MNSLTISSYAKINLTLDVFSKRADGYHSIASVMQTISLADTLTFTRRDEPGIGFECLAPEGFPVPNDTTNLAYRAAELALRSAQEAGLSISTGVHLQLRKRTPAQAGLGGGSSNAAAALTGVNRFLQLGLPSEKMAELAASLGSDVPFFLLGGTAAARGRGETLSSLPDIPKLWLVVVKPEESVSTGWAYSTLDAIPDRPSYRATKRMEEAIRNGDTERLIAFQCNDFELPVFEHFPKIAWVHDELRMAGATAAHLCGSGAAVYGIAPDEPTAHRIAGLIEGRYPGVYVAHTLTRAEANA